MRFSSKLIAVLAAVPLGAAAQTTTGAPPAAPKPPPVQLYGTINVNLQYTEASGATAPGATNVKPRAAVSIDSSNIGVKGAVQVSDALGVVLQCETQATLDGDDLRALCNRNSRIGVTGDWGTVFYGNWDTPYKALAYGTKADDPFGNTDVFGFQGIFGSPGYGTRSAVFQSGTGGISVGGTSSSPTLTGAGFDQRAGNSVAYHSPKFTGLSAKVQYSVDEYRSTGDGRVDPQIISGGVNYDAGGLSVAGGVEYHEDMFGIRTINSANAGNNAAKDWAWRLAAGYELPTPAGTLRVVGMAEQLTYAQRNATAGYKDYSRVAWLAGATFRTGKHEVRARYSQALAPNITAATGTSLPGGAEDDLGAQQYAIGYAYHVAASTQLYAFATQIVNESKARYTFGIGGAANVVGANTPAGSDPLAAGLGIRFSF